MNRFVTRLKSCAFLLVLLLTIPGCVKPDPLPLFRPAWEPFDPKSQDWIVTRPALLVSDCQLHNLYSLPIPDRNLSIEGAVGTAIRPPQLDLFAEDVLQWVLENGAPEADVVLHLGDGLDLACEGELQRFLAVMEKAKRPWFMAPGNHDFYYFGSYDPENRSVWRDACHEAGEPLTKDRFIRLYVGAILGQEESGCAALAKALGLESEVAGTPYELASKIPLAFDWQAEEGATGLLRRISWKIDVDQPWRSFILQAVDLSPPKMPAVKVQAFLMDSCQYSRRPVLIPNAWSSYPEGLNCGSSGEMLPDQLRLVRTWIDELVQDDALNSTAVIMCHHPFEELAARSKASLGWLWDLYRFALMVSAHTHRGFFAYHEIGEEADELEINLASTTDWPMEWRVLAGYFRDTEKGREVYFYADRRTLLEELRTKEGFFQVGWEVQADAPDDYRRYRTGEPAFSLLVDFYLAHHLVPYWLPQPSISANAAAVATETAVKDTLLGTYRRLLFRFPTDPKGPSPVWPKATRSDDEVLEKIFIATDDEVSIEEKIAFLKELEAFERSRSTRNRETLEPNNDERLRFKLSQAVWASRYESQQGRFLRVEDDLIHVDAEQARAKRERLKGILQQEAQKPK